MSERVEKSLEYKKSMNCAQAVIMAFSDLLEQDEETLLSLTTPFGLGIGGTMEGTCGAVTGACMVVGLLSKESTPMETRKKAGQVLRAFKEQNSTVTCKELKGIETGVVLRSCNDCVKDAVEFLEKVL